MRIYNPIEERYTQSVKRGYAKPYMVKYLENPPPCPQEVVEFADTLKRLLLSKGASVCVAYSDSSDTHGVEATVAISFPFTDWCITDADYVDE